MADPRSTALFAALRTATRLADERFLVGVPDDTERERIAGALSAEGEVVATASIEEATWRLAREPFELAVVAIEDPEVARACAGTADLVVFAGGDTASSTALFAAGVAAVLPRPLPTGDALLRAHVRWLASCRRSRSRGVLLAAALERHGAELASLEPALAQALAGVVAETAREPNVLVMGDAELVKAAGGTVAAVSPDVVVVGLGPEHQITARLQEARVRASGAAVVVVDTAPDPERLSAALYAGVRACVERRALAELRRVIASMAARRRGEVTGRRLVETLARFGVLDEYDRPRPTSSRDVDVKLIVGATARGGAVVPSDHEVLVVDDEVVVLAVLREALRRGGYRVTTAASAEEAIELMHRRSFDLVLTDKNLPGASGLEVLREARTIDPQPAVVLITGYSSYDSAVQALDIGAQDYIEKPIRDVEDLRFRVRRALSRRNQQLAQAHADKLSTANGDGGRRRVLVVEVDDHRRKLVSKFLDRHYEVTTAANADQALALLQEGRYDVVLADRNLPGASGGKVIEQARSLLPHCAAVLFTEYPSYDTVKEAFELGVDAYLVRPSEDLHLLAEKVASALRSRGGILLG